MRLNYRDSIYFGSGEGLDKRGSSLTDYLYEKVEIKILKTKKTKIKTLKKIKVFI